MPLRAHSWLPLELWMPTNIYIGPWQRPHVSVTTMRVTIDLTADVLVVGYSAVGKLSH